MHTLYQHILEKLQLNKQTKAIDNTVSKEWINMFFDIILLNHDTGSVKNMTHLRCLEQKIVPAFYNKDVKYQYAFKKNLSLESILRHIRGINYLDILDTTTYIKMCDILDEKAKNYGEINSYAIFNDKEYVIYFSIEFDSLKNIYLLSNTENLINTIKDEMINRHCEEINDSVSNIITIENLEDLYHKCNINNYK